MNDTGMHPRISVSAICTATLTLSEDIDFWARHGIGRVGASVAKMEAHGWDDAMMRLLNAPVAVGNVIGPGPFTLDQPDLWPAQQERAARIVDCAAALGADTIVFTTGPANRLRWEAAAGAFGRAMGPTVEHAHGLGVNVTVEHTNSLRADVGFLHSLPDAIDLARELGIGVCMEINACWAERGLFDTIAWGLDTIGVVQISDYAVGTTNTPNRLVPGDGDIPIEAIVTQLVDCGYPGRFDLEVIGPRIEEEGYDRAVPRSVAWLTDLLERLGV